MSHQNTSRHEQPIEELTLEKLLMERITREQEKLGLSDKRLGDLAFSFLSDTQKKMNNLKHYN